MGMGLALLTTEHFRSEPVFVPLLSIDWSIVLSAIDAPSIPDNYGVLKKHIIHRAYASTADIEQDGTSISSTCSPARFNAETTTPIKATL